MAGAGECRRDSLCYSGRKREECSGPWKEGHVAYQVPGPGSVARFLHHLLPVRKNTFEKSRATREPLQSCCAGTFCKYLLASIPLEGMQSLGSLMGFEVSDASGSDSDAG